MRRGIGRLLALGACTVAQLACSGDSPATDGSGGSGGRDGGGDAHPKIEITPADALFQLTSGDSLLLVVSDVKDACGYSMRSEVKAGARAIVINIVSNPFVAGTYTVNPAFKPIVQAYYAASDAACRPIFAITPFAKDGSTIVIRSITTDRVEGSYALDFGSTMLSGDFQAQSCSPLLSQNPACVP